MKIKENEKRLCETVFNTYSITNGNSFPVVIEFGNGGYSTGNSIEHCIKKHLDAIGRKIGVVVERFNPFNTITGNYFILIENEIELRSGLAPFEELIILDNNKYDELS